MKRIVLFIFTFLLGVTVFGQEGSFKLNRLEYANFPSNGYGYLIYTPDSTGQPQYYLFEDLISDFDSLITDDQQLNVTFTASNAQLDISLEDGGSFSRSLFSLEDRLQLQGNLLSIIGNSEEAIDLSPYLDNTDEQVLSWAQVNDTLQLTLTNSGTINIPISDLEIDPVFVASVAATITQADIDSWNNHVANDLDLDPTNERDSLVITDVDFQHKNIRWECRTGWYTI